MEHKNILAQPLQLTSVRFSWVLTVLCVSTVSDINLNLTLIRSYRQAHTHCKRWHSWDGLPTILIFLFWCFARRRSSAPLFAPSYQIKNAKCLWLRSAKVRGGGKEREGKAGLAGDKKPQLRRRMLLVGGSVSIKNSCQKSSEPEGWRKLESEEYGKPAGGGRGRISRIQRFIIWKHSSLMLLTVHRWSVYSHTWLVCLWSLY